MQTILVLHGAGMDMRGKSQLEVFGPMTLPEYEAAIKTYADELDLQVDIFHSNIEGELVDKLYRGHDEGVAGGIINPAGFTTGYPALGAAISQVGYPVYELHVSNPALRGRISEIGMHTKGVISGFGVDGYRLALEGLRASLQV